MELGGSDNDPVNRFPDHALREGASVVFERGSRKKPEIDEEQVKELHAKNAG